MPERTPSRRVALCASRKTLRICRRSRLLGACLHFSDTLLEGPYRFLDLSSQRQIIVADQAQWRAERDADAAGSRHAPSDAQHVLEPVDAHGHDRDADGHTVAGTTLMRKRRIRPLSWASTSCPASHCTRYSPPLCTATTVPCISMRSSLLNC